MGQSATHPCGHCGTLNNPGDQFCSNCGYLLSGGSTGLSGTFPVVSNAPASASASARRIAGALAVGELLGGRYRNLGLVGQGGFGAVYKAADERFKSRRTVAIKEMSDGHLNPAEKLRALDDFRQEADLLVQLRHPNLPDVSDFFEEGGKAYLVMEFIEGKTLEKMQEDSGGPLAEQLVMGWALQLCDVLGYLHGRPQPIIFRDLKPSNVIVTNSGQVKLIDFGIARIFKSIAAKDTTSLGSRGYAPLEQYGRGQSDARSDIYALGATLYDLLTNSVPVDAPTRRVNPTVFMQPRQVNPTLSKDAERVILKAMAEEPKDRYQSAGAMFQAIVANGISPAPAQLVLPGSASSSMQAAGAQTMSGTQIPTVIQQAAGQPAIQQQPRVSPNPTPPAVYPPAYPPLRPGPQPPSIGGASQSGSSISRRGFILGGLVAAGVLAGGGFAVARLLGGGGSAASETVRVDFTFSTEKADWLNAALKSFNSSPQAKLAGSSKIIQVVLNDSGSLDIKDKIVSGDLKPVAWSPANQVELQRLAYAWTRAHGQDILYSSTELAPQPLVSSPLVMAVWQDRAQAFISTYKRIDWDMLHTALLRGGWASMGHPEWNAITLGQTHPDRSNSGLLSIILMAYAYAHTNGQNQLTLDLVKSADLWKYIQVFEQAVNEFGDSSGSYFTNTVIPEGRSAHSITFTYENLVLLYQNQALQSGGKPLQIYYPTQETISRHPFAILNAPWVTSDQVAAARQFRDFLLSSDQQKQALQFGFRPSDLSISLTDSSVAANPFNQLARLSPNFTFDAQNYPTVTPPQGDVVDELISQWATHNPNV